MTSRLRIVRIGVVALSLLAMSAMAAPPFFSNNSRNFGNEVNANVCTYNPDIQLERCADLYGQEYYDVKGTYQFTGIGMFYSFHRDYADGSSRNGMRSTFCMVGLEAIKAKPNLVTLEAVLDANSPECESWGMVEDCDPWGQCISGPWEVTEVAVVTGEWIDPTNTSKAVINRTDEFFDPWSETTQRFVTHCNEDWGELMAEGGFTIDFGGRVRDFPFEGYDTQGWSNVWLRSCNENFKAK